MSTPAVSIVLPTYNGQRYLADAIESCRAQTMDDWELILVDDCSTDRTPEIISRYAALDSRVRAIRNPANRKLPGSLNAGFALSRAGLLTWTSDDNLYRPVALETLVRSLEARPEVDFVYSDQTFIDESGREVRRFVAQPPDQLLMSNVVNACFMYRRRVYEVIGDYDESMFLIEDYDYWLRVSTRFQMQAIHADLYDYRWHAASLSSTRRNDVSKAFERALEKHLPAMAWATPEQKAEAYWLLYRRADVRGDRQAAGRFARLAREHSTDRTIPGCSLSFDQAQHFGWLALKNGQVRPARRYAFHSFTRRPWDSMAWRLGYCAMRGR